MKTRENMEPKIFEALRIMTGTMEDSICKKQNNLQNHTTWRQHQKLMMVKDEMIHDKVAEDS